MSILPRLNIEGWKHRRASAARDAQREITEADADAPTNRKSQASSGPSGHTPVPTATNQPPVASSSRLLSADGASAVGEGAGSMLVPAVLAHTASSQSDSGAQGAPSRAGSYDGDYSTNERGSQGTYFVVVPFDAPNVLRYWMSRFGIFHE
ncbi:hypothetical protein FRC12_001994 [Ceratobasidium sp. 428]|nr:hypothetical protein FRC12_001994 [Ceratobasidium sp. 428]